MNLSSLKQHLHKNAKDYAIFVVAYVLPLILNVIIFRSGLFMMNPVFVAAATLIPVVNWGLPFVYFSSGVLKIFEIVGGWILS